MMQTRSFPVDRCLQCGLPCLHLEHQRVLINPSLHPGVPLVYRCRSSLSLDTWLVGPRLKDADGGESNKPSLS
jgi:hypothetical protein